MLFSVLTSSAIGLAGLLIAAPAHVNALVTPGSGSELGHLAARRLAGVSPNHHALARRKTNAHKKRQRCQQRPVSPNSTPAPQQTGTPNNVGVDILVGGGGDNSNPTTTPPAPANTGTPPPAPAGGNGKLILAWPNGREDHVAEFFTGKASYYYNWSPYRTPGDPGTLTFCPMLWGDTDNKINEFTDIVKRDYATCVLAMNEVNQEGQALMNVDTGVGMWNNYIAPLQGQGYNILGSPVTTSAPDGLVWLLAFLPRVQVKPTHICVHWYHIGFDAFTSYMENHHEKTGYLPILITEFACQNYAGQSLNHGAQCSEGEIWSFVRAAVPWMDEKPWIHGYAPFGFMRNMQGVNELNKLMTDDGHPTALGSYFITGQ